MKCKMLTGTIFFAIVFLTACTTTVIQGSGDENSPGAELEQQIPPEANPSGYSGQVLAGSSTPYIEFSQVDFNKAVAEDKTVFLYFYANWCPTCKAEEQELFAAFNELDKDNFIGFRVNYKDSETDDNEQDLARQYGVSYQHTKIVLKGGEQVLKALDSWDKGRYLTEIGDLA